MRIIVLFRDAFRVTETGYAWVVPGIEASGHEVLPLDPMTMAEVVGWDGAQRQLLRWIAYWRPHLILTFPPYHAVDAATVQQGRALGARWVGLRYDDPILLANAEQAAPEHEGGHLSLSRLSGDNDFWDLTFSTSQAATELLGSLGQKVRYGRLPIAHEAYATTHPSRRPVFSFVGSWQAAMPGRTALLQQIHTAGLPLEIWGSGWQSVPELAAAWQGPADPAQLLDALGGTVASLCISGYGPAHTWPMIKLRLLEIAAAGGLAITEDCPELTDYFQPGAEVLTFHRAADLLAQLQRLLQDPGQAAGMGRRALARVQREHGWGPWLKQVNAHLAAAGRPVQAGSTSQAPELAEPLAEGLVALAHGLESAGRRAWALPLYRRALGLLPTDSGALAGIRRCSDDQAERRQACDRQIAHAQRRLVRLPPVALTALTAATAETTGGGLQAAFEAAGGLTTTHPERAAWLLLHAHGIRAKQVLPDTAPPAALSELWGQIWAPPDADPTA